jgi:hypothetical protein
MMRKLRPMTKEERQKAKKLRPINRKEVKEAKKLVPVKRQTALVTSEFPKKNPTLSNREMKPVDRSQKKKELKPVNRRAAQRELASAGYQEIDPNDMSAERIRPGLEETGELSISERIIQTGTGISSMDWPDDYLGYGLHYNPLSTPPQDRDPTTIEIDFGLDTTATNFRLEIGNCCTRQTHFNIQRPGTLVNSWSYPFGFWNPDNQPNTDSDRNIWDDYHGDGVADSFDHVRLWQIDDPANGTFIDSIRIVLNRTVILSTGRLTVPYGMRNATRFWQSGLPLILDKMIEQYRQDTVFSFLCQGTSEVGRRVLEFAAGELGKSWSSKYPAFWYSDMANPNLFDPPYERYANLEDEPIGWCRLFALWILRKATGNNNQIPTAQDPMGFLGTHWLTEYREHIPNNTQYEDLSWIVEPGDLAFVGHFHHDTRSFKPRQCGGHISFFIDWDKGCFDKNAPFNDFWAIGGNQWHGRVCINKVRVHNDRQTFQNDLLDPAMPHYAIKWFEKFCADGFRKYAPKIRKPRKKP